MKTATIYFSDKTTLVVSEEDIIIPVIPVVNTDDKFASMDKFVELYNHIHDGLIPSIMNALCFCSFFYINKSDSPIYCTHSIVKIENN